MSSHYSNLYKNLKNDKFREKLEQFYDKFEFPLAIRFLENVSTWIEKTDWKDANAKIDIQTILTVIDKEILLLKKSEQFEKLLSIEYLRKQLMSNLTGKDIKHIIIQCLEEEKNMIAATNNKCSLDKIATIRPECQDHYYEMKSLIEELRKNLKTLKDNITNMTIDETNNLENFEIKQGIKDFLVNLQKLLLKENSLYKEWKSDSMKEIFTKIERPRSSDLDKHDIIYSEINELIFDFLKILHENKLLEQKQIIDLNIFLEIVKENLNNLLVVTKSSGRIIKISKRKNQEAFSINLRFIGGNALGLLSIKPSVKVSLHKIGKDISEQNGDIISNNSESIFEQVENQFEAKFSHLYIRMGPNWSKDDLYEHQKYCFYFETNIEFFNMKFDLQISSPPIFIIHHKKSDLITKGLLIWHAAYFEENILTFRKKVLWSEFSILLNKLFIKYTDHKLNNNQLDYLKNLAIRSNTGIDNDQNDFLISYEDIILKKLSDKDHSFWEWTFACVLLISENLKPYWNKNHIYGFISREAAKEILIKRPNGTFLLRFSETELDTSLAPTIYANLSIAVKDINPETGKDDVYFVKQYLDMKNISEIGLSLILNSMRVAIYNQIGALKKLLTYLYPAEPMLNIFKIDSNQDTPLNGYHKGVLNYTIILSNKTTNHPENNETSLVNSTHLPSDQLNFESMNIA